MTYLRIFGPDPNNTTMTSLTKESQVHCQMGRFQVLFTELSEECSMSLS